MRKTGAKRRAKMVDEGVVRNMSIACYQSMLQFKAGNGNDMHWHTLAKCLNVAMMLSKDNVIPEGLSAIDNGLTSLVIVKEAGKTSRTWGLGSHAFAINCAVQIFLRQIEIATNVQVNTAEKMVMKEIKQSQQGCRG